MSTDYLLCSAHPDSLGIEEAKSVISSVLGVDGKPQTGNSMLQTG